MISELDMRTCKQCGKQFAALRGDAISGGDLMEMIKPICDECKAKNFKNNINRIKNIIKGKR